MQFTAVLATMALTIGAWFYERACRASARRLQEIVVGNPFVDKPRDPEAALPHADPFVLVADNPQRATSSEAKPRPITRENQLGIPVLELAAPAADEPAAPPKFPVSSRSAGIIDDLPSVLPVTQVAHAAPPQPPAAPPQFPDFTAAGPLRPPNRKGHYLPWLVFGGGLASAFFCLCSGLAFWYVMRAPPHPAPAVPFTMVELAPRDDLFGERPSGKRIVTVQPIQPALLAGSGISKDWQVIFRSADPSIWDKDVNDGEQRFASSLSSVPSGIQYLRIRKNSDYVIFPVTTSTLREARDDGWYGWNGVNESLCAARHLGVYDIHMPVTDQGRVCVIGTQYAGWGFGHIAWVDDRQGYCWAGKPIAPTVFEIAVKPGPLTTEETKCLRKNEKR
jgi:hypothetical protein